MFIVPEYAALTLLANFRRNIILQGYTDSLACSQSLVSFIISFSFKKLVIHVFLEQVKFNLNLKIQAVIFFYIKLVFVCFFCLI